MAYTIFRSDLMSGTKQPADLVSIKCANDIENGSIVKVGGLVTGEHDVYTMSTPTATTKLTEVVILGTPEVMYDERQKNLNEFINLKDDTARGYRLISNNIFSVTTDGIDGTAIVGSVIELQAGLKLKAVATLTAGSTKVGDVIAIEGEYVVIRVA